MTHEDWFDLFSTIEVKEKKKRAETQTKKIASDRSASLSDRYKSVRIMRKKKARTGVLHSNMGPHKRRIITMVPSAIVYFARRQECLSGSICRIVTITVGASIQTRPSSMEWGDIWEAGLIL